MVVWSSVHSLADGTTGDSMDGFHLSDIATSKVRMLIAQCTLYDITKNVQATQMLLNLVCNDNMNFNDGTCCKSSDKPTSLQVT